MEDSAVSEQRMGLQDGSIPGLLDIIDVPLGEPHPFSFQPENYLIADGNWRKINVYNKSLIESLVDNPPDLWGGSSDRIVTSSLRNNPPSSSLYLIKPSSFRIFKSKFDGKLTACFEYNTFQYGLKVTDLKIESEFEKSRSGNYVFENEQIYLCVSLGVPFQGFTDAEPCCYKLVASVIRIPLTI